MIRTHDEEKLPSTRALRALEATARLGSFTAAAAELCVTQGAISRQIQELEQLLGQQVFRRSGPNLALTDVGARFAQKSSEALAVLRQAVREVQAARSGSPITLSMLPSVATKWFAPRLGRFTTALPDIDLRIAATRDLVSFSGQSVEAGIRYGRGRWPGTAAELLGGETVAPVCTPAFAAEANLRLPQDLAQVCLFHADIEEQWSDWFTKTGSPDLAVPRGPSLGDDAATLQAVLAGQGVALGRSRLIADDLATGRLIYPFQCHLEAAFSYWFVTAQDVVLSADLRAVKDWVKAEFDANYEFDAT